MGNRRKPPVAQDAFIGREEELQRLIGFGDRRLVTIVGLGGSGKTRLATHYSVEYAPEPVAFCRLSRAQDPEGVLTAAAKGLGLEVGANASWEDLARAADDLGELLVVLDNAEQVIDSVAGLVRALLDETELCRVLVTSREPLSLSSERVVRLDPMGLDEAVQLFVERVRQRQPDFDPSAEDLDVLRSLAHRVDRLPLAVEMAAGRMGLMTPAQLLERVAQTDEILSQATADGSPRHASLEATMEWSWRLLTPDEQALLAALSLFDGAFTLQTVEAIVDDLEGPWVGDVLESLIDHSLVQRDFTGAEPRFGMFETVRAFAARRLDGERRVRIEDRHARHYADMFRTVRGGISDEDTANIVAAFARLVGRDPEFAAELALGAYKGLRAGGTFVRMLEILEVALASETENLDIRSKLFGARAVCKAQLGRLRDALADIERGLAIADVDARSKVFLLATLGTTLRSMGEWEEAAERLVEAVDLLEQIDDPWLEPVVWGHYSLALLEAGRTDEAEEWMKRILAIARDRELSDVEAHTLSVMSRMKIRRGRFDEAHGLASAAKELHSRDRRFNYEIAARLGEVAAHRERWDEANAVYLSVLEQRSVGDRHLRIPALFGLAALGPHAERTPASCYLEILDILRGTDDYLVETHARMRLAVEYLADGDVPEAQFQADRARHAADELGEPHLQAWAREIAHLITTAADEPSDPPPNSPPGSEWVREAFQRAQTQKRATEAEELRQKLAARLQQPRGNLPPYVNWPGQAAPALLIRVVEAWQRYAALADDTLRVNENGTVVVPPHSDQRLDLSSRAALALIVAALAEKRRAGNGETLTKEQLVEIGWPGEFVTEDAGASRVYTAIRTLRKMGLEGVLVTDGTGYLFDPQIPFETLES